MDNLERLREAVRKQLDLQLRLTNIREEETTLQKQLTHMQMIDLPDMFAEANVDRVGLPAEGNHPGYDAVLKPYYKAVLPANNPDPGLAWLNAEGHGDIIKTIIEVRLGRGEGEIARKVEKFLEAMDLDYTSKQSVPWNTLTAFVREQIEKYGRIPPLELLGGVTGMIVTLKERKD